MSKHKNQAKKKVSIIIPFYGQTESELSIPLSSINNQIGVDFATIDVHLVNDGGAPVDITKFDIFENLDLHYHELPENVGPGLARQYGIDNSEGEYLMFIDSDDTLYLPDSLKLFFFALEQPGEHQLILSNYVIQKRVLTARDTFYYETLTPASTAYNQAIYGKWFKRIYLKKIGLRFSPELTLYYEDSYFSFLAHLLAEQITPIPQICYMRRHNKKSITHVHSNYRRMLDLFTKSTRLELQKIREVKPEIFEAQMIQALATIYLSQKKIEALDKAKLWEELHQLVAEFSYDWTANFQQINLVANAYATGNDYFKGIDTSDLREFLDKI